MVKNRTDIIESLENQTQLKEELGDKLELAHARLEEKGLQLQALEKQANQAFSNLEHFRAATQDQRHQEQLQADTQRKELQVQIKELYDELYQVKATLVSIPKAIEHKNQDLQEEKRHVEKRLTQVKLEHLESADSYSELLKKHQASEVELTFYRNKLEEVKQELANKHLTIIDLTSSLKILKKEQPQNTNM